MSGNKVSYNTGIFMLIAFAIGGMIFGGLIASWIVSLWIGVPFSSVAGLMEDPAYIRQMQFLQTATMVLGFLVPTLYTASRLSPDPVGLTGFRGKITPRQVTLVLLIMVCTWGLSSSLGYFTYQLPFPQSLKLRFDAWEADYGKMAAGLMNLSNPSEILLTVVVLAVVPAICEEALFRGGFQNYLYRSSGRMWTSVLLVSLVFSLVHFSAYGFLSRFALGMILGLIYHYSGRLWLSILAHFLNNVLAIALVFSQKMKGMRMEDIMQDRTGSYWGFILAPVLIYLVFLLSRQPNRQNFTDGI